MPITLGSATITSNVSAAVVSATASFDHMTLSNASIPVGTSGTVGTLSTIMRNSSFVGSYAVTYGFNQTSFQIVNGNQLATTAALAAGTYDVVVAASQTGINNGPLSQHFMIISTASASGTIVDIVFSPLVVAGNSPAGTAVGTVSVVMSTGNFTGTLAVTGSHVWAANNGQPGFTIVGNQIRTVGVVPPGRYGVGIRATQTGVPNSPFGIYASVQLTGTTPWWTTPPPQAAAVGYNTLNFSDDFLYNSLAPDAFASATNFNWFYGYGIPIHNPTPTQQAQWVNFNTTWHAGDSNMTGAFPGGGGAPDGGANASPSGGILKCTGAANNVTMVSTNTGQYNIPWWYTPEDGIFRKSYVEAYLQYNYSNFGSSPYLAGNGWPAFWSWTAENMSAGGGWYSQTNSFVKSPGHAECDFFEQNNISNGVSNWGNSCTAGPGSVRPLGGAVGWSGSGRLPPPPMILDNAWHSVGYLWTNNAGGCYFDNNLIATGTGLNAQYETGFHQNVLIGCGLGWPTNGAGIIPLYYDWVRVWGPP